MLISVIVPNCRGAFDCGVIVSREWLASSKAIAQSYGEADDWGFF